MIEEGGGRQRLKQVHNGVPKEIERERERERCCVNHCPPQVWTRSNTCRSTAVSRSTRWLIASLTSISQTQMKWTVHWTPSSHRMGGSSCSIVTHDPQKGDSNFNNQCNYVYHMHFFVLLISVQMINKESKLPWPNY